MPSLDNPGATVTSDQVAQIQATLGIVPLIFDSDSYTEQSDASYEYYAWNRLDGAGYKSERWTISTQTPAGINTGIGSIPADLTSLSYS